MFAQSMTLPADALIGFPALVARMSFGDVRTVGPFALLPIGLAIALFVILLVARDVTRRYERRQIGKSTAVETAQDAPISRAA